MNAKSLRNLSIVAVVVVGAAIWSSNRRGSGASGAAGGDAAEGAVGKPLFPELVERANDVATVTVTTSEGSFTIERTEDRWGLREKGGYAVDLGRVRELVNGIAFFEVTSLKTENPEYYDRLGVADVTPAAEEATDESPRSSSSDSEATRVTLKDDGGATLADVLIGNAVATRGGSGRPSLYVRRPGAARSFEVTGRLSVDGVANNWLDKAVMKVEKKRVHEARTVHPDGEVVRVVREDPDAANFAVSDVPEGRELKWNGVGDSIAGALEWLNFDDVQPRGAIDFEAPETVRTTWTTKDGLVISARLVEQDEKAYAEFDATFDQGARLEPYVVPPPPPVQNGEDGESGDASEEAGADEEPPPTPDPAAELTPVEDVRREAAELAERLTRWTFVLPGYTAANMKKRMQDLLKEPEPAPPEDGAAEAPPPPALPVGDDGL